ncbi:MAG: hypothetical protein ACXW5U_03145 [Thermoanaerobaculia bacterium]
MKRRQRWPRLSEAHMQHDRDGKRVDESATDAAMQAAIVIRRVLVILAFAAASCRPSEDPAGRSAAIVIAEGATDVHYTTIEDEENIAYEAPLPYPAAALIAGIEDALKAAGYTRVDDPNAFRWTEYEAADDRRIDHWNGTWRAADGIKTAETILEYRGRRGLLHVWARVGATKEQAQTSTTITFPVEEQTPTTAIELAESDRGGALRRGRNRRGDVPGRYRPCRRGAVAIPFRARL